MLIVDRTPILCEVTYRPPGGCAAPRPSTQSSLARLIKAACAAAGVAPGELVLHSDNGGPMRGATLLATLQQLGVMPSYSRPRVSDDNPYSEALFRTLKYVPWYPRGPFADAEAARLWVEGFVRWYRAPAQRDRSRDAGRPAPRKRPRAARAASRGLRGCEGAHARALVAPHAVLGARSGGLAQRPAAAERAVCGDDSSDAPAPGCRSAGARKRLGRIDLRRSQVRGHEGGARQRVEGRKEAATILTLTALDSPDSCYPPLVCLFRSNQGQSSAAIWSRRRPGRPSLGGQLNTVLSSRCWRDAATTVLYSRHDLCAVLPGTASQISATPAGRKEPDDACIAGSIPTSTTRSPNAGSEATIRLRYTNGIRTQSGVRNQRTSPIATRIHEGVGQTRIS
jgi:hypothetical protein